MGGDTNNFYVEPANRLPTRHHANSRSMFFKDRPLFDMSFKVRVDIVFIETVRALIATSIERIAVLILLSFNVRTSSRAASTP